MLGSEMRPPAVRKDTDTTMADPASEAGASAWERRVLERLVLETVRERRRARRWSIFFRLLLLALIVGAVLSSRWSASEQRGPHTAVVRLDGEIAAGASASADNINAALRDAFKDPDTRAVILRINSPGGSPVQASQINDEIGRLRQRYPKVPIYAVCDDLCASAAYYAAVATERIYVSPASMVGSIGVLMDGFGFTGLMDKLGVSRRLLTAGANKGFLDPFSPMPDAQKAYAQAMLEQIHQQFIAAVEKGRGSRLKVDSQTFSGLVWTGQQAVARGLADAYGDTDQVARQVVHEDTIVTYSHRENVVDRLARRLGAAFGGGAAQALLPADWQLR